jgi:D-arabinose 1-dehydrogenase-like Zn-dependent alcohol dehydrogenase
MRAVIYESFGEMPRVAEVPDPTPPPDGVVIAVEATGLCRSDWHGWKGHDPGIVLPHTPGHEFAGTIAALGSEVHGWAAGDRVTAPFVCACGTCPSCQAGDHQVCENQQQPGFTHAGSFAGYVVVHHARTNLVRLPDRVGFAEAAALGCRFATSFRAVVAQGRVRPGDWLAVYGCGGVGLSAIMIGAASGARVVAVDVSPAALELASAAGAEVVVNSRETDAAAAVRNATGAGAHVSIDALGSEETLTASIGSLRRRGRHVQVGLLPRRPVVPVDRIVAYELELLGSHGMAAHAYPSMMALVESGRLRPAELITREIALDEVPLALSGMGGAGMTIIRP